MTQRQKARNALAERDDKTYRVDDLVAIKQKLRKGRLDAEDLQQLEAIVVSVERAAAALRAAVVE